MPKNQMNHCLIIVLAIVSLLVAISIYYHFSNPQKEKYQNQNITVMLFYATWCPHCVRYLESGKWDSISNELTDKFDVVFAKYDYDKNKDKGDKYRVSSFPTIIAEDKNGKVYRFHGDRSKDVDLEMFLRDALKGKERSLNEY